MDFYIDGGGGGSTGGLPTGWDTGSPGVTGGGGLYEGQPTMTYGHYRQSDINNAINTYNRNLTNKYNALMSSDLPASSKYALDLVYGQQKDNTSFNVNTGAGNAVLDMVFTTLSNPAAASNFGNSYLAPKSISVTNLPDSEVALLAEYNKNVPTYDGYNQSSFTGNYSKDAYAAWLADQKAQYDKALAGLPEYQNSQSAAIPKVAMPNGAPTPWPQAWKTPTYDAELQQLYEPKLLPYNPLSSDWNGSFDAGNLISGLLTSLLSKKVPSGQVEKLTSPSFGEGLLSSKVVDPNATSDEVTSVSNPWQSKNLIKPASYFDDTSQGVDPPKGLMGQDMVTQNNVLPSLQLDLQSVKNNTTQNKALDEALKPITDEKAKLNATKSTIDSANNKWKSSSLNKIANWRHLA